MASSPSSAKDRVAKAVVELDSYKDLLSAYTSEWKDLDSFIAEIDRSLAVKLQELDAKEKEFEVKNAAMSQALDRREEAIPVREKASLARLHEQQEAAMEKYRKPTVSPGKHASAPEESRKATAEVGKAEIDVKGEKLQTKKKKKKKKKEEEQMNDGEGGGGGDEEDAGEEEGEGECEGEGDGDGDGDGVNVEEGSNKVKPRPELILLCENMDGEGLRNYLMEHWTEVTALRNEIRVAMQSAIDPLRLVLDALEGYQVMEPEDMRKKKKKPNNNNNNNNNNVKDNGPSANRRACILLMECLSGVLSSYDPQLPVVPPNIKEAAMRAAELWKSKHHLAIEATSSSSSSIRPVDGGAIGNEISLDAQAILQLLSTFGIASEFPDEDLLKLVYAVCRRKQTPALCRELGLEHKMPGFVETLSKDGKQIEALCFAHHFGIMDKIQPGAMLKSYMKEARRVAQETPKNSANPKYESMMKELSAVRAVLKAVEDYKLGDQFPVEGLQKRFAQLEKSKADRRKASISTKNQAQQQQKRPRLGMGSQGPSSHPQQMPIDRGQYVTAAPFGSAYDRRPQPGYNSMYGADTRSPSSIPNSYIYPADVIPPSVYPTAPPAYSNLPTGGGYSSYPYGTSQTPYPSQFLR